jgi:hypothetical protein
MATIDASEILLTIEEYLTHLEPQNQAIVIEQLNAIPHLSWQLYSGIQNVAHLMSALVKNEPNNMAACMDEFFLVIPEVENVTVDMYHMYLESEVTIQAFVNEYNLDNFTYRKTLNSLKDKVYMALHLELARKYASVLPTNHWLH